MKSQIEIYDTFREKIEQINDEAIRILYEKLGVANTLQFLGQYRKGSGYLSPTTPPGADGFEASAQGDLDGDGVPSTFARSGVVGPSGSIVLATTTYVDNELE